MLHVRANALPLLPPSSLPLRTLGQAVTESDLKEMIAEVDADNSGELDFPEFLTMMVRKVRGVDIQVEIEAAFASFDQDNSGTIDSTELEEILSKIDRKLTKDDINAMISEADVDGDGQINYSEVRERDH